MLKLGLIGCGKMGGALLRGVVAARKKEAIEVALSDKVEGAADALSKQIKCKTVTGTPAQVAGSSEAIILAVKPQDMKSLCKSLARVPGERLYISIAAGVAIADLEDWLGKKQRVIRSMPNTPALVGSGAAAFARGANATEDDAKLTADILSSVGTVDEVSEKLLDAVTGLSGSGPAYAYTFIESLADAGVLMGLPRASALQLAAQTVAGAAKMVMKTGKHPAALRDEVTSPGGTTIAGLEQLEAHGFRNAILQAVRAATKRSKELGV
jgi:pyrroline-5-carboxylate reductase